jgi:hypothetical protein
VDSFGLGQGPVTGFYEYNIAPLESIKEQEFLDHLYYHELLRKDSLFHGVNYLIKISLCCILNDVSMVMWHNKLQVTIPSVTTFAFSGW